jgi:hypothetical protein
MRQQILTRARRRESRGSGIDREILKKVPLLKTDSLFLGKK